MKKKVFLKIDRNEEMTLREVMDKLKELQDQHPDLDVFFDGDEYAICGRPDGRAASSTSQRRRR